MKTKKVEITSDQYHKYHIGVITLIGVPMFLVFLKYSLPLLVVPIGLHVGHLFKKIVFPDRSDWQTMGMYIKDIIADSTQIGFGWVLYCGFNKQYTYGLIVLVGLLAAYIFFVKILKWAYP